jgi:hypothetical protein
LLLEKSINIDLHHETFRHTYTVNGILRDVGDVTNNGVILTTLISRGLLYVQGQGVCLNQLITEKQRHIHFSS